MKAPEFLYLGCVWQCLLWTFDPNLLVYKLASDSALAGSFLWFPYTNPTIGLPVSFFTTWHFTVYMPSSFLTTLAEACEVPPSTSDRATVQEAVTLRGLDIPFNNFLPYLLSHFHG